MEHLDIVSLLLRLITGILFFFQGVDKIFKVKISNVVRTFDDPANPSFWPRPILKPMITISSYVEMICGIFLFFGFLKFYTLSILSIDLIFIALTLSSIKAMWDMQFFLPRFLFVLILWVIPFGNDVYCLDRFLNIGF